MKFDPLTHVLSPEEREVVALGWPIFNDHTTTFGTLRLKTRSEPNVYQIEPATRARLFKLITKGQK